MNKTQKLTNAIVRNLSVYRHEIETLERRGPRGGRNAKSIQGWSRSPHVTITKAINQSGENLVMNWWDGSNPTPSSAIPSCIVELCKSEYQRIFKKEMY